MGRTREAATKRRVAWLALGGALAIASCTTTGGTNGATGTTRDPGAFTAANAPIASPNLQLVSALEPFPACDQLLDYVKQAATERVGPYGFSTGPRYPYEPDVVEDRGGAPSTKSAQAPATTTAPPTSAPAGAPADSSGRAPESTSESTTQAGANGGDAPAHSETNVQEQGVDEPDTIKTDGKRILALSGNRMIEVDVTGAAPQTVGSIVLPGNGGSQLLLAGNHVLAIDADQSYVEDTRGAEGAAVRAPTTTTLLSIVDIGDPANMKILNTVRVDGTFVSARMVDGQARVVTSSAPVNLPFVNPSGSTAAAQEAATKANKAIIADSKIEDWLPVVHVGNGSTPVDKPLLDCAKVSHPKTFSGFGTLAVLSIDVGANEVNPADAVGIMADGQTVYASKTSLYVSTPAYVDPPRPTPAGTTPTTVAPAPIPLKSTTSIHKFDIGAKGAAVYRASGDVEGSLLSQFSMSEDDGFLRVATTTSSTSATGCRSCTGGNETFVRVLHEADGELKEIGSVGDMGHGEQVKAVRFVGKQGYVVTFRQTDPLYTLDLSTPTAPKVAGALKLLGYSAYLHPAGDNLLIGIGQDATERGRALGTKVALYDMSDIANPRELQQYVLWNSTSEVEQDFHAFNFWAPTKLAIVPVDRAYVGYIGGACPNPNDPNAGVCAPQTYLPPFTGAIGLTIDRNGISELGRIVNPGSSYTPIPDCERTGQCVPAPCPPDARCTGVVPVNGGTVPAGGYPKAVDCSATPCGSASSSNPVPVPTTAPTPGIPPTPTAPPCYQPPSSEAGPACPYPGSFGSRIERSVVVGDTLFTFSSNGIKSSELSTLHEKWWLPFF